MWVRSEYGPEVIASYSKESILRFPRSILSLVPTVLSSRIRTLLISPESPLLTNKITARPSGKRSLVCSAPSNRRREILHATVPLH